MKSAARVAGRRGPAGRTAVSAGAVPIGSCDTAIGRLIQEGWHARAGSLEPSERRDDASPHAGARGQAVSPGIAIGPVVALDPRGLRLPPRSPRRRPVPAELARLDQGLRRAGRGGPGRGRRPTPARPPVRRHPRGARPDDLRPDPSARRPGADRARPDHGRARRHRGARGARDAGWTG